LLTYSRFNIFITVVISINFEFVSKLSLTFDLMIKNLVSLIQAKNNIFCDSLSNVLNETLSNTKKNIEKGLLRFLH